MSRILVFQHVAAEPLGTLDPLIRQRGHRIRFVNFERTPEAEPEVDGYRGLVVLGGPMNVEDQAHRPHLRVELRAIERALELERPVLGICLGAQLLAHVLGAPVRRHDRAEIGWYRLHTTAHGAQDPLLSVLAPNCPVFQWHSRSFALPQGAQHLARTDGCEQQAFRWGEHAYGFQFHLEMDRPLIARWLATPGYREDLASSGLGTDPATIMQHTEQYIDAMQARARTVFEGFLDRVGRPARRVVLGSR